MSILGYNNVSLREKLTVLADKYFELNELVSIYDYFEKGEETAIRYERFLEVFDQVNTNVDKYPLNESTIILNAGTYFLTKYRKIIFIDQRQADFFVWFAKRANWSDDIIKLMEWIDEKEKAIHIAAKRNERPKMKELRKELIKKVENELDKKIMPWARKNVHPYYAKWINDNVNMRIRYHVTQVRKETGSGGFGEAIRKLRTSKNMTLSQVAKKVDVSPSYIARLEKNERAIPDAKRLRQIAKALQITNSEMSSISGINVRDTTSNEMLEINTATPYRKVIVNGKILTEKHQMNFLGVIEKMCELSSDATFMEAAELVNQIVELKKTK